jgi:hypothetical protein
MRLLACVAVLVSAAWSLPARADCAPAKVEVTSRYVAPWTEYVPIATLNDKYRKTGEHAWLGSTSTRLQAEVLFQPERVDTLSGACTPSLVRIDVSFAEHDVNLAKEIQSLPCVHKTVRDHEEKHVALNKEMLLQIRALISTFATQRVRSILRDTSTDRETQAMELFVAKDLQKYVEEKWNVLSARQAAFDTPQEYNRITSACPVEMASLARVTAALAQAKPRR